MSDIKPVKTWERTRVQKLMRHKSGRYYARLYRNGKETWEPLNTTHFSVAEASIGRLLAELRKQKKSDGTPNDAKLTFSQAAGFVNTLEAGDPNLKRRTRAYHDEVYIALVKSWPELAESELRKVTPEQCQLWRSRYASRISPTRFNGALARLRRVFAYGVERGIIYSNPAADLEHAKVRSKIPEIPTRAEFAALIAEMRAGGSRDSNNCADLAEGLAYTGCRKSEAAEIIWRDVRFAEGSLVVKGDPEEGTKNSEQRSVPLNAAARALFERMRAARPDENDEEKVFLVHECQGSIDRSSKKTGVRRITHHGFRHYFVTICIQSGVDVPTLSFWVGHKDGGKLLMKTYHHLLTEHSHAAALKVSFGVQA